jgi:cyclophilin family peptidyl-prolyl cis-trans isomerase
MKSHSKIRSPFFGRLEPLEPRLAMAVTLVTPIADITRPSTATTETISLAGTFNDTAVTGTVVQFKLDTGVNDKLFVELFDQLAPGRTRTTPKTVENFLSYVDDGSYTNTIIHRRATNPAVLQGGGFKVPTADSDKPDGSPAPVVTKPPIVNESGNSNVQGTIAMARTDNPNSATSQWFINVTDNTFLDPSGDNPGYAVFGRVLGTGPNSIANGLINALATVPTYPAGAAFGELPLRDMPNPLPANPVVRPGQYVTVPSISRADEMVYTVTSSDPSLVTGSIVTVAGISSLQLDHKPDRSGTAEITVRAASVFNAADFVEDKFLVVRQAPAGPVAPVGLAGIPGNGRVRLNWKAPAAGGSPITDYVVQVSTNNGSSWTAFNDGTSPFASTLVTGLANGTSYVFRVAAVNGAGAGTFSAASAPITPRSVFAVGAEIGVGSTPVVQLVNAETGAVLAQATVFEPGFRGGVRVGMGDLDNNGIPEIVVASGAGRVGEIRVFRQRVTGGTTTLRELPAYRTLPFGARYTGGVEVAVGDVDGNGRDDLVAAMARGAGTVSVFRSVTGADPIENAPYRTFTPFDARFDGGATVAVADVGTFVAGRLTNAAVADKRVEIVVGSGAGMQSTVRVYDISATPRAVTTILPFAASLRGGVSVSAGRYDTDEIDDIVVSAGRGGGSAMRVFNGRVDQAAPAVLASSAAFAALARPNAPVFSAPIDIDGDGRFDRLYATQGDAGGTTGVLHVAKNGIRVGALGSLKGPFRIAAPRRT